MDEKVQATFEGVKIDLICKKLAKGMPLEEIADFLEEPLDVMKGLAANL